MASEYVLAVDVGTSSIRAVLYRKDLQKVDIFQIDHDSAAPHPGWVEQDPMEILQNARRCIDEVMRGSKARALNVKPTAVACVGVTVQRESCIVWDKMTGGPLYPAIIWNDMRTEETVNRLLDDPQVSEEQVRSLTGLPISTYFSAVKVRWMRDNVPAVDAALEAQTALFGTFDTWLVWHLTGKRNFVTDVTNASRTLLMNLSTRDWDDTLLAMFGVPREALPEIKSCSGDFGVLEDTLLKGTPITGVVGDQQAALIGQAGFEAGHGKCTFGTGGFLMVNTGTTPKFSNHGLLTTPAYQLGENAPVVYALEGSVAVAGAALKWLKENLGFFENYEEMEALAAGVPDTGDVYFVPAFAGLFAPRWRSDARGCIVGLTQHSTKAHIVRATLEAIAFQTVDVVKAVELDMQAPLGDLRVDGGVSQSNLVLQFLADFLGKEVVRPEDVETTARGAAIAAGLHVGLFESVQHVAELWAEAERKGPNISEEERAVKMGKWEEAVQRSLRWTKPRTGLWKSFSDAFERLEHRMEHVHASTVAAHVAVVVGAIALCGMACTRCAKR